MATSGSFIPNTRQRGAMGQEEGAVSGVFLSPIPPPLLQRSSPLRRLDRSPGEPPLRHDCRLNAVFDPLDGYKICADRSVAEKIEKQTNFVAHLYNVDVRRDTLYMAGARNFPSNEADDPRFSSDFENPLRCLDRS
jgi:hypothetical protein